MTETNIKDSENIILNESIKQIGAFSSGTHEKFVIVNELINGRKTVSELQDKLPTVGKSTLYKYLWDLEQAKILKKDTMGSKIYYSLGGFSVVLTPGRISELLGGNKEDEEKRFNDMLKFDGKVNIFDRYSRSSAFYPGVLLSDLLYCGIKLSTGVLILMEVIENLHEGITSREISTLTRRMIGKRSKTLANDYKKYILGAVNVETEDKIELWDDEMIEKVIKTRHKVVDIPVPELGYLSHRTGRHLKRIGKVIPENLAVTYIDYMVSTYVNTH